MNNEDAFSFDHNMFHQVNDLVILLINIVDDFH